VIVAEHLNVDRISLSLARMSRRNRDPGRGWEGAPGSPSVWVDRLGAVYRALSVVVYTNPPSAVPGGKAVGCPAATRRQGSITSQVSGRRCDAGEGKAER
jgi:hypothetical protein